ncbi:hypothetical protein KM043_006069 [Ampulex compressa]|nr:hypothetical protein KM043_006069 [Ampulex compressa]
MADEVTVEEPHALRSPENIAKPRAILLFSGKRKSGKDFITDILHERIGPSNSVVIKLSGPIKAHWAKSLNLDIDQLLGDGKYKENHRHEMVKWGESIRKQDYGYFCSAAIDMYNARSKPIWIVSDVRRKTDIKWFVENFGAPCKNIRIVSDDTIRANRGWVYRPGIDDSETECDLDVVDSWDLIIENNGEDTKFIIERILKLIS